MAHLKRLCWLAAWSVWVWLGVGLHRELPRNLGRPIHRLPFAADEMTLGLIDGTSKSVSVRFDQDAEKTYVRRWDVAAGTLEEEIKGAWFERGAFQFQLSPTKRFMTCGYADLKCDDWRLIFVNSRAARLTMTNVGREIVDLSTGKRSPIPDHAEVVFHPVRPLAAFWFRFPRLETKRVQVVDLESGRRVFEWPTDPPDPPPDVIKAPCFVGDDRIAIPVASQAPGAERAAVRLELWTLGADRPLSVVAVERWSDQASTPAGGRVAWQLQTAGGFPIEVFDCNMERLILPEPLAAGDRPIVSFAGLIPTLSADGRMVLGPATRRLTEVDTGRIVWAARRGETLLKSADSRRFETFEPWDFRTHPPRPFLATHATRELSTGRLLDRVWHSPGRLCRSDDGRFMLVSNEVHGLPLNVNWPLLALCQAILASPLILLWLLLRRRRKRRLRLEGAAP
jgi:hypothetical protein